MASKKSKKAKIDDYYVDHYDEDHDYFSDSKSGNFKRKADKEEKMISSKTGRKVKKHYVNPDEFKEQILQFYEDNIITDELAKSISDIAHRLGFAPNFCNYTYIEEMVGDAIIKMFQALHGQSFNPKKGLAFTYYTTIAYNAFRNRIKKEKREHETICNYQEKVYDELISEHVIQDDQHESAEHIELGEFN